MDTWERWQRLTTKMECLPKNRSDFQFKGNVFSANVCQCLLNLKTPHDHRQWHGLQCAGWLWAHAHWLASGDTYCMRVNMDDLEVTGGHHCRQDGRDNSVTPQACACQPRIKPASVILQCRCYPWLVTAKRSLSPITASGSAERDIQRVGSQACGQGRTTGADENCTAFRNKLLLKSTGRVPKRKWSG